MTPSDVIVRAGPARLLISDSPGDLAIVDEVWRQNAYRYHPRPNDIVVDVGAHKGIFSTWCAMHGAFVHAYEPSKASFETMLINLRLNSVETRVTARNMAIWSQACRLPLYHWPGDAGGNSLLEVRQDSEDVLCTTLEEAFTYVRWCDFLKVDTEGAEFEILGYASDSVLQRVGALAVEIHSPALDPGGREHPVKFTAYTDEKYERIVDRLRRNGFVLEELRAANGDPNYVYAKRG